MFESIKRIKRNLGISEYIECKKENEKLKENENDDRLKRMGFNEKEYFNNWE